MEIALGNISAADVSLEDPSLSLILSSQLIRCSHPFHVPHLPFLPFLHSQECFKTLLGLRSVTVHFDAGFSLSLSPNNGTQFCQPHCAGWLTGWASSVETVVVKRSRNTCSICYVKLSHSQSNKTVHFLLLQEISRCYNCCNALHSGIQCGFSYVWDIVETVNGFL